MAELATAPDINIVKDARRSTRISESVRLGILGGERTLELIFRISPDVGCRLPRLYTTHREMNTEPVLESLWSSRINKKILKLN